jgi:hypothetical protein
MRVSARELATWSFLVATAHGAGLMVLPFVLGSGPPSDAVPHHHAASLGADSSAALVTAGVMGMNAAAVGAALVHTVGYLAVTALLAVVVYEKVGLGILRRAWINLNVVWSIALIAAAGLAALA